jgi:hypothetical protein
LFSRICGGTSAASTSIGIIGAVLKTPRIFRRARFCIACRGFLTKRVLYLQIYKQGTPLRETTNTSKANNLLATFSQIS